MGDRYKDEGSLIDLGIVEQVTGGKDVKLYKLTDMGKEIIASIKRP
jgi:predicted transcriptional regulator with HTH domain